MQYFLSNSCALKTVSLSFKTISESHKQTFNETRLKIVCVILYLCVHENVEKRSVARMKEHFKGCLPLILLGCLWEIMS